MITDTSFNNCHSITHIYVESNPIRSFHRDSFRNNRNLVHFGASGVVATELPFDLFHSNPSMREIQFDRSPSLTDIAPNFFENCPQLVVVAFRENRLHQWRPEWLRNHQLLDAALFQQNVLIPEVPRNALNSPRLLDLFINSNSIRYLDFFSINSMDRLRTISLMHCPIEGLDFNIFDRARSLGRFDGLNTTCFNANLLNFGANRETNMALLEPCFEGFDRRVLGKCTIKIESFINLQGVRLWSLEYHSRSL